MLIKIKVNILSPHYARYRHLTLILLASMYFMFKGQFVN